MRKPLAALAAGLLLTSTPGAAREVDRQEVAERFAPDVAQEQRVYCRDTQVFALADGTEFRACVDWRAHFAACAATYDLLRTDEYSLRIYETGVWLGGR